MRITLLRRGGLSVYGGSYDAARNVAITLTDRQQTVTLVYPETITALSLEESGIDAGSPVIVGTKATFTISGSGHLDIVATMGAERPYIRIEAETYRTDRYGIAA